MTKTKKILPTRFEGESVSDGDRISFEHNGFTVVATIKADYDADVSDIGEFSNTPEAGAIDHHATGTWLERSHQGLKYFNPCNYDETDKDADKTARLDYERLVAYYRGEWSMVGVVLTVSRDGVKLGDASLWNIESDSGSYFNEAVQDLLHEVQIEAKAKLKLLAEFAKEVQ